MARATAKALLLLRYLHDYWEGTEGKHRYEGVLLSPDHLGLAECLEAGWVAQSEDVPGRYRITESGAQELRYAGEEIDDKHNGA